MSPCLAGGARLRASIEHPAWNERTDPLGSSLADDLAALRRHRRTGSAALKSPKHVLRREPHALRLSTQHMSLSGVRGAESAHVVPRLVRSHDGTQSRNARHLADPPISSDRQPPSSMPLGAAACAAAMPCSPSGPQAGAVGLCAWMPPTCACLCALSASASVGSNRWSRIRVGQYPTSRKSGGLRRTGRRAS